MPNQSINYLYLSMEGNRPEFNITFLGGASDIGASCTLFEFGNTRIVIDCGIRFTSDPLPDLSVLEGKNIDAIFLTHAHTDHTGALPVLCEAFPAAPVYATAPTFALVEILLRDAIRLMKMQEAEGDVPLYTKDQLDGCVRAFHPVGNNSTFSVNDMQITFMPGGHILGAVMVHIQSPAGNILFTGDYSITAQRTVPALNRPVQHCDLVVTESTYGERLHENRNDAEKRLVSRISGILEQGGKILIPAFAIGRAQELLLILNKALRNGAIPSIPIYVDGMVRAVCDCYRNHANMGTRFLERMALNEKHPFYSANISPIAAPEQRQKILESDSCIIVASSGMLAGGPSAYYAAEMAPHPQNAILITGYQDEESPGRKLLELAEGASEPVLNVGGKTVEVACRFEKYGLSAHADKLQIAGFLSSLRPHTTVLVHGDNNAKAKLAAALNCSDIVSANNGESITRGYPVRQAPKKPIAQDPLSTLDLETVQKFLGPVINKPLNGLQLASAWLGRPAGHALAQKFIGRLESLGLVKRDDQKPMFLWQKVPEHSGDGKPFSENAKGVLLEMAAKLSLPSPRFQVEQGRFEFQVNVSLSLPNEELVERAAHRVQKQAEQLAAKKLFNRLLQQQAVAAYFSIDEPQATRFKKDNPKGKLFEMCMQRKLPMPDFRRKVSPEGLIVQACLSAPGLKQRFSNWFLAKDKKTGEQAACHHLLQILKTEPKDGPTQLGDSSNRSDGIQEKSEQTLVNSHAHSELNLLKQKGYITDFSLNLVGQKGPSHAPCFSTEARCSLPSGEKIHAGPVDGSSKKEGQKKAASALLEKLIREGL